MNAARQNRLNSFAAHGALILYTLIALFPVFVIVINSFKTRKAIFREPLALPNADSFSLIGYETVLRQGDFFLYFQNSMIVTVGSLFFILLFGAMAAFALAEYRFKGNTLMGLYLALGIMIPIRIGTVAILEMMVQTGLVNTLWALGFTAGDRLCLTGGVGPHYASYLPSEVLTGQQNCLGSALDGAFQLAKRAATKATEAS